ncbi:hypothetical protein A6K24_21235 [Metabacillus litoralis]|uniref:Uncharacterized protein n=1 Tax=Metabacillus litoralis TaxID=152268 RepID=A0A179SYZ5_9BACI|nr:hypothetical protein A6K24_21235 [Metabacillus litoralis]
MRKKIISLIYFFLASITTFMYNRQCWSLTAMKQEVADTHGRFAMACVGKILAEKMSILKIGEKEGK